MSNATDELRSMLDELGVEHYDGTVTTLWLKDGVGYRSSADEGLNGYIHLHLWCTTPAQAIYATLGLGTCYDVGDSTRFVCSECGCSLDLSDLDGEPTMWVNDMADTPNYCPNCGREVVDG